MCPRAGLGCCVALRQYSSRLHQPSSEQAPSPLNSAATHAEGPASASSVSSGVAILLAALLRLALAEGQGPHRHEMYLGSQGLGPRQARHQYFNLDCCKTDANASRFAWRGLEKRSGWKWINHNKLQGRPSTLSNLAPRATRSNVVRHLVKRSICRLHRCAGALSPGEGPDLLPRL